MGTFTKLAERCLQKAKVYAKRDKDTEIRISHVIFGILNDKKKNFAIEILDELNVDVDLLLESITMVKEQNNKSTLRNKVLKNSKKLIEILKYASENKIPLEGKKDTSVEDIFFAVMFIENELSELFRDFALEPNTYKESALELDNQLMELLDEELYEFAEHSKSTISASTTKNEILDKYCVNLNKMAIEGNLDPCFGREKELGQMYRILSRVKKRNAILIGKAGVGKTNIAEGLAQKIISGEVPDKLKNKLVYSLNLNAVVAGTKYRGMFEERIQGILDELNKNKNSILFIDEIHNIMGAGNAEGTLDLSNILKPYISKKGFQIIGATTTKEYKKRIERDKALKRRFSPILVNEPSTEVCIGILNKLKSIYEDAHSVTYTDAAIEACVHLSNKYITYRTLPDKAIDLLDDAAVRKRLKRDNSERLQQLQKEYNALELVKKKIISTKTYEKAEEVKKKSNKVLLGIKREKTKIKKADQERIEVTENDVKVIVEEMTNIPIADDGLNILGLKEKLDSKIFGQSEAIKSVIKTLMINKLNLDDGDKPIGSFMFVGYSGVGKTQLVRELCRNLFGDDKYLVRFDCSEYAQKHEVSKLIGAPAGYVGYQEGGLLTEAIKRNPFSVILFDEIEKAHDKMFDILLQILGEGRLTDNQGELINFKNTIVILTSNIGIKTASAAKKAIGFSESKDVYNTSVIDKAIKKRFRPEFVNRLDNIIHFNILSKDDLMDILEIELKTLTEQVSKHNVKLKISASVKQLLVNEANIPECGARALKRTINDEIKTLIAEQLIRSDEIVSEISLVIRNKKIIVK